MAWKHESQQVPIPAVRIFNPEARGLPPFELIQHENIGHAHTTLTLASSPAPTLKGHLQVLIGKAASCPNMFNISIHGPNWHLKPLLDNMGMRGEQGEQGYVRSGEADLGDSSFWADLSSTLQLLHHNLTFAQSVEAAEKDAILNLLSI